MTDMINRPPHYAGVAIEPIEICEQYPFTLGCALKYLARAGKKEGASMVDDLKKARWYLRRFLEKDPLALPHFEPDHNLLDAKIRVLWSKNPFLEVLFCLKELDVVHCVIDDVRVKDTISLLDDWIDAFEDE